MHARAIKAIKEAELKAVADVDIARAQFCSKIR